MRLLIFITLFVGSTWAATECSKIGKNCKSFLNTTLSKLTAKFTSEDEVVCMINNDLGACIADANDFSTCADVLANNSNKYMQKLMTTKIALAGVLTDFISCLSGQKDVGLTDFLTKTVLGALKAKLKLPFESAIQPTMKTMKASGKPVGDRLEQACIKGTAITTTDLISQIVKKDMLLTYSGTWTECVIKKVVAQKVLTLAKYIKTTYKKKATCPSG
ncbi:unnamed protein product, partial [Mesorhabditis belari]|uniref:Uncharacterized protein n=1 Tax=Mesorhabditis belari TaxID=2138241 RepID=A0AAF3EZR3_9BILA